MMMAYIEAYRTTSNRAHLEKALLILESFDRHYLDKVTGSYWGHHKSDIKGLSGNNNMAWVLLDLYEATGQELYLEKAGKVISYIVSPDIYDNEQGILCHHFEKTEGRASYACTGCNFHFLYIIFRYNRYREGVRHESESELIMQMPDSNENGG